jgi:putative PIN family toxin of toxin-antitoxin system
VISDYILDEFSEKLRTKFGYSLRESYMARNALKEQCIIIEPQPLGSRVSRDVEDDPILAAASDGHCDCLITGDKDLLVLRTYNGIPIFKPSDFFAWERRRGE